MPKCILYDGPTIKLTTTIVQPNSEVVVKDIELLPVHAAIALCVSLVDSFDKAIEFLEINNVRRNIVGGYDSFQISPNTKLVCGGYAFHRISPDALPEHPEDAKELYSSFDFLDHTQAVLVVEREDKKTQETTPVNEKPKCNCYLCMSDSEFISREIRKRS